jgi:hypothetical protein
MWHRSPEEAQYYSGWEAGWEPFARWCAERQVRDFPAAPETVLAFVEESGLDTATLRESLDAIYDRHEGTYWHSDGNPMSLLLIRGMVLDDSGGLGALEPSTRAELRRRWRERDS